ncbi:TIGR03032 family protein [Tautonia plasticadhaerens]|uniref:Conserved hypothetical protein CHP03032 domain-containing protein n=1 Tax=Tautonia plasticadhaerens TaxID=2527974 RepID=A0A518H6G9_9BACT|nr:TIGR03032 family protein [Tautonia plasticadhaerens]QDV36430.1 hypothetical protein ElP_43540 [Tautonia plasticadhaerens]
MSETDPIPASPIAPAGVQNPEPLASVHTANFPALLDELGVSLALTTYQAGRLVFVRSEGDRLNTHFRSFDRPMGMATLGDRLAVGCGVQVWEFRDVPAVAAKVDPPGRHDACYLPRRSHVTGDIDVHEMEYAPDGALWLINTRFSCLCTLRADCSFAPRWRPPFVSALAPEDRCHLNGLSLVDGAPRYATALGTSDAAAGWRSDKARGGVLMDIPSGEIVVAGLSMPHSPRLHAGRLWLLESGDGSIGVVDPDAGRYEALCRLPGFTRGIDIAGPIAFVGLSQVRESAVFSGIPLADRLEERTCGVYAVHLETGQVVAFKFTSGVQEIFAIRVLAGRRQPELLNETVDLLKHAYVLPEADMADVAATTVG